jgi:hypothetical protein
MGTRNAFLDSKQPQILLRVGARPHLEASHLAKHFANMDAGWPVIEPNFERHGGLSPENCGRTTAKRKLSSSSIVTVYSEARIVNSEGSGVHGTP